jgi:hypothetical protein
MGTRDILLLVAVAIAVGEIIRIRLMFMLKGVRHNAIIKDYALTKEGAYAAIMEFTHDGEVLNVLAKGAYKKKKYDVGTEFEIMYIPGKNDYVKITKEYMDIKMGAFMLVCGIVMLVCSLLK